MSACCNESGCRRKKPIMLMRDWLTGTWFVVTDYAERGTHPDTGVTFYIAKTKHALPDDTQRQLEAMRDYYDAEDAEAGS